MSFGDASGRDTPHGLGKIVALNWSLIVLICAVAATGFLMLYSVAGGSMERWAEPQMIRCGVGMAAMILLYETLGGMRAVAWTDAAQGVLMLVAAGAIFVQALPRE